MDNREANSTSKKRKRDWKDQLAELDAQLAWDTQPSAFSWGDEPNSPVEQQDAGLAAQMLEDHQRSSSSRASTPLREVLFFDCEDGESAVIDEDDEAYHTAAEEMDDTHESFAPFLRGEDGGGQHQHQHHHQHHHHHHEGASGPRPAGLVGADDFEVAPWVEGYIEHRLGPTCAYEDRCLCHEWLVNVREQRLRTERMLFARMGMPLQREGCVLREYPQADGAGVRAAVDSRPVLVVTTPEGKTLYPHDERDWPYELASSVEYNYGV